jgi:hypothetical protein
VTGITHIILGRAVQCKVLKKTFKTHATCFSSWQFMSTIHMLKHNFEVKRKSNFLCQIFFGLKLNPKMFYLLIICADDTWDVELQASEMP